jgi:hypothetical protein
MVKITTRGPQGHELVTKVPGDLPAVAAAIARATDGTALFPRPGRISIGIPVAEIVSIEEIPPSQPRVPTRAEFIELGKRAQAARRRGQAAEKERRAACRGGCEVITRAARGTDRVLLARPVQEVNLEVLFAPGGVAHVSDGLGAGVTIKARDVITIRSLD